MHCRLCLQEKPLIKKSHIIPDFMYKGIFDDKHKIVQKDFINNKDLFPSDGIYEKHILCADCDNKIIGGYEDYTAKELFKPTMHGFIEALRKKVGNFDGNETNVTMSRIEYKKAKLFHGIKFALPMASPYISKRKSFAIPHLAKYYFANA
ncbi:hypothetical protein EON73_05255 [bacterium]|nr:MAG: hypothetical protein EON73_05255 [bacterium]